ncbi:MAG: GNAT family protein [Acidaminobacteraceae bacterium]
MIRLESERLIIRDHIESDLENHHSLISDIEVMTYIQDIMTNSLDQSKENLEFSIKESRSSDRRCYFFLVELKKTKEFVGSIGFTITEQNKFGGLAEIGYFILKKHWGNGYVTEAARLVIDYIFNEMNLHKIYSGCNVDNIASENIMKKLGMKKEGHLKSHICHNGMWKDRVLYGKIKKTV